MSALAHLVCRALRVNHLDLGWTSLDDGVAEERDHHDKQEVTGVHQVEVDHRAILLNTQSQDAQVIK